MVFLAVTKSGLLEALLKRHSDDSIWCACGAIAHEEFRLNPPPLVTRLDYALDDADSIQRALWSIEDHHPDEPVWVETKPADSAFCEHSAKGPSPPHI